MNKKILGMALVAGSLALSTGAQASFFIDTFSDDTALTTAPNTVVTALSPTSSDFSDSRSLSMDTPVGPGNASFIVFAGGLGTSTDLFTEVNTTSTYNNAAGFDFTVAEAGPTAFTNSFVIALTSIDQGGVEMSLVVDGIASAVQSLDDTHTEAVFAFSEFGDLTSVNDIQLLIHNNIAVDASFDSFGSFADVAPPVNTPEPTSLALLGLGLAAFGFGRRKAK